MYFGYLDRNSKRPTRVLAISNTPTSVGADPKCVDQTPLLDSGQLVSSLQSLLFPALHYVAVSTAPGILSRHPDSYGGEKRWGGISQWLKAESTLPHIPKPSMLDRSAQAGSALPTLSEKVAEVQG